MNAETQLSQSEEQAPEGAREAKGFRAFMRRPITLISSAAVVAGAVLGVVVLGDLSGTETTTAVASTHLMGSTGSTGDGSVFTASGT